jgi:serine/threonine protein kinase
MPTVEGFDEFVEIGRGGFGVVYRARQPALDRMVAIKFLASSLNESGRERLAREARAMGALSGHPNIVAVLDVSIPSRGEPYLVMPYFARGSLADLMARQGRLPWPDAVNIGVKLAGALESSHRLGILHRDVKPGNVLVSDFGEPELADFGLARVAGGFETTSRHITASVAHAPPEILDGRPPSVTSDVYSLASTLYALIAGTPAFTMADEESLVALYLRVASAPVPNLRELGVPDSVSTVIERAMSKRPEDRPPSAAAFGRQLQEAGAAEGITVAELPVSDPTPGWVAPAPAPRAVVSGPTRDVPRTKRRPRYVWLAIPAAVAVLVAAVLWVRRPSESSSDAAILSPSPTGDGGSTSNTVASPLTVSCLTFPSDAPWYQPITDRAVDPQSDTYISSIEDVSAFDPKVMHAGFGSTTDGDTFGTTYSVVDGVPPTTMPVQFDPADRAQESDPGPYDLPADAAGLDGYVISVDNAACRTSELYGSPDTRPWEHAEQGGIFDLNAFTARPDGQRSAIQSGLPMFPMLVRYEEVRSSTDINHALLVNAPVESSRFVAPATRGVEDGSDDADLPPLGTRFRLKASYSCAQLATSEVQKLCKAMQTYGVFLGGSSSSLFELQGVADERWDNDAIHDDMKLLAPTDFEAVTT